MTQDQKQKKDNITPIKVSLRVSKAKKRDSGRNIARIDPSIMDKLNVNTGNVLALKGEKLSAALAWPNYPQDVELGIVRIDSLLRRNIGSNVGDSIEIYKAEAKVAQKVVLVPVTINIKSNPRFESFIKRKLNNYPITLNDYIFISIGISKEVSFKVIKLVPEEICVINSDTILNIVEDLIGTEEIKAQLTLFENIGGLDRQIEEINKLIQVPLQHPLTYKMLGIKPPKGILLVGPSGCGKTLLAKAIANETAANFISINGPEIISKYAGESEKKLRKIFEEAQQKGPSIIFIDHIDTIATKINKEIIKKSRFTQFQIVSQLLTLMDGLHDRSNVIVIGATNKFEILESSLLIEGRFSKIIEIEYPNEKARLEIFKIHIREMPLANDIKFEDLVKNMGNFSGADIKGVCREAALSALKNCTTQIELDSDEIDPKLLEKIKITNTDFLDAIEIVTKTVNMRLILEDKKEEN